MVGIALGLWFGVNIGRDAPLLSNPFTEERNLAEKARDTATRAIEKGAETAKEALEKGEEQVEQRVDDTP